MVYIHRRESSEHDWELLSDRPHPDWLTMSVDEYGKYGRSEVLQAVSPGEILRLDSAKQNTRTEPYTDLFIPHFEQ